MSGIYDVTEMDVDEEEEDGECLGRLHLNFLSEKWVDHLQFYLRDGVMSQKWWIFCVFQPKVSRQIEEICYTTPFGQKCRHWTRGMKLG